MKICFISTNSNATPPVAYGGEGFFWEIAKNLGLRGHDITLYAAGGSECPPNGKLKYIESDALSHIGKKDQSLDSYFKDRRVVDDYLNDFLEADIIHDCSHHHYVAEYLRDYHNKWNSVNTINGNWWLHPRDPFNIVVGSNKWKENGIKGLTGWEGTPYEQKVSGMGKLKDARVIYWGTNTDFYCPDKYKKDDYFLFFSRFHPSKGPDVAINLAKKYGFKLIMSGSIDIADHMTYAPQYFEMIKGCKNIEYVPIPKDSKHHEFKRELYRKARALIFPGQNAEPFGMVVTEALACGTPVITNDRGAMPEIVNNNETGFIVPYGQDMDEAVKNINKIDPRKCVADVVQRFDTKILTTEYEKLYKEVINGSRW